MMESYKAFGEYISRCFFVKGVQLMATDRQTPCLYYICAGLCKKGRKADHAHYCQHCDKYKPRARVRYKNQKKEKLEKIRKEERY